MFTDSVNLYMHNSRVPEEDKATTYMTFLPMDKISFIKSSFGAGVLVGDPYVSLPQVVNLLLASHRAKHPQETMRPKVVALRCRPGKAEQYIVSFTRLALDVADPMWALGGIEGVTIILNELQTSYPRMFEYVSGHRKASEPWSKWQDLLEFVGQMDGSAALLSVASQPGRDKPGRDKPGRDKSEWRTKTHKDKRGDKRKRDDARPGPSSALPKDFHGPMTEAIRVYLKEHDGCHWCRELNVAGTHNPCPNKPGGKGSGSKGKGAAR